MVKEKVRESIIAQEEGERSVTNILHLAELIHKQSMSQKLGIEGTLNWFDEKITTPDQTPEHEIHLERDADAQYF